MNLPVDPTARYTIRGWFAEHAANQITASYSGSLALPNLPASLGRDRIILGPPPPGVAQVHLNEIAGAHIDDDSNELGVTLANNDRLYLIDNCAPVELVKQFEQQHDQLPDFPDESVHERWTRRQAERDT